MAPLPFPQLHLDAFRGLHGLHLDGCGPVNLLVGANNSGKTSALEALVLLSAPCDPRQWEAAVELRATWPLVEPFGGRGIGRLDALEWLFPRLSKEFGQIDISGGGPIGWITATVERIEGMPPDRPIVGPTEVIEGMFSERGRSRRVVVLPLPALGLSIDVDLHWTDRPADRYPDLLHHFRMVRWETGRIIRLRNSAFGPALPLAFATPFSHRAEGLLMATLGQVLRSKEKKAQTIALLQRFDTSVQSLAILPPDQGRRRGSLPRRGEEALYIDLAGTGYVPISTMGDGLRRALHFAGLVADLAGGGVLLVDDIDVGLHTSVLREVFGWLCAACKEAGVQLFATTHSLEAVDAVLASVPSEDLVLYRLRDGQARRYGGDRLHFARVELGHEVR